MNTSEKRVAATGAAALGLAGSEFAAAATGPVVAAQATLSVTANQPVQLLTDPSRPPVNGEWLGDASVYPGNGVDSYLSWNGGSGTYTQTLFSPDQLKFHDLSFGDVSTGYSHALVTDTPLPFGSAVSYSIANDGNARTAFGGAVNMDRTDYINYGPLIGFQTTVPTTLSLHFNLSTQNNCDTQSVDTGLCSSLTAVNFAMVNIGTGQSYNFYYDSNITNMIYDGNTGDILPAGPITQSIILDPGVYAYSYYGLSRTDVAANAGVNTNVAVPTIPTITPPPAVPEPDAGAMMLVGLGVGAVVQAVRHHAKKALQGPALAA